MASTIGTINPFRYKGYYYDAETGFYYQQTRYYDPVTHRFLNADGYASTGQGFVGNNMFAYCLNNPVMRVDPTGHNSALYKIYKALLRTITKMTAASTFSAGFASADEAAADFTSKYSSWSTYTNMEVAAVIIRQDNMYYYSQPKVYLPHSCYIPAKCKNGTIVASIHTHPHPANTLVYSDGDISHARDRNINFYIATSGGYVAGYNVTGEQTFITSVDLAPLPAEEKEYLDSLRWVYDSHFNSSGSCSDGREDCIELQWGF